MSAYYGFYEPLESLLQINGCVPADFDLGPRRKTPTLRTDLQALGCTAEALEQLPMCAQLPVIDSSAAGLGVLYVLEGATLGGQILRREIATRLGLDASNGAAFLDIYGAATGRRWRSSSNTWAIARCAPRSAQLSSRRHKPHSAVSSAGSSAGRYWHDPARQRNV